MSPVIIDPVEIEPSDFSQIEMEKLLGSCRIRPALHQMERHCYLPQRAFMDFHRRAGVHVTAYSPLGNTNPSFADRDSLPPILQNGTVKAIAAKYSISPANVLISLQLSVSACKYAHSYHHRKDVQFYPNLSAPSVLRRISRRFYSIRKTLLRSINPVKACERGIAILAISPCTTSTKDSMTITSGFLILLSYTVYATAWTVNGGVHARVHTPEIPLLLAKSSLLVPLVAVCHDRSLLPAATLPDRAVLHLEHIIDMRMNSS